MKHYFLGLLVLISGCASKAPIPAVSETVSIDAAAKADPFRRPTSVTSEFPTFIRGYKSYTDEELAAAVVADGVKSLSCRDSQPFTVTARQGNLEIKSALTYGQGAKSRLQRMDLFVNGTLMCQFRPKARGLAGKPSSDETESCEGAMKIELYETCCARGKTCTSLIE